MKSVSKLITLSTIAAGAGAGIGLAGPAAFAYWGTTGTGSGSAQVGTLNPVSSVVAGQSGLTTTVNVSWTPTLSPNGGAPTGYLVERIPSAGSAVNACGTSAISLLPGSATTCADTVPAAGTYTYRVTTFFGGWTAQRTSSAVTVVLDTTAPAPPVVNAFGPVTGANKTSITVGGTAEPNSSLVLTFTDGAGHSITKNVTTPAGGTWTLAGNDLSSLNDGTTMLSVTATDAAGNTSSAGTRTATKDTVAPAVTITSFPAINNANKSSVPVSGTAESGSSVLVTFTDAGAAHTVTASVVASGGTWSLAGVNLTSLNDGIITASAVATDSVGNASAAGLATAAKDIVAPSVMTLAALPTITNANKAAVPVSGTATAGSTVTITLTDPGTAHTVTKTLTGVSTNWSTTVDVSALNDGTISASAVASDAAGNLSTPATRTIAKDATAPTITSVTRVDANPATTSSPKFLVTFSETVLNVGTADFAVTTSGSFTTAAGVTSVSGSGSAYTVTASTGAGLGDATLGLKLATAPTINDSVGNAAAGGGTATVTNDFYSLLAPTGLSVTAETTWFLGYYLRATGAAGSNRPVTVTVIRNSNGQVLSTQTETPSGGGLTWQTEWTGVTDNVAYTVKATQTSLSGRTVEVTKTATP